uniref:Uncharacterized protein n=1 Tax=Nymphaea colorata TaxID=210225 RepID=A0A5K0XGU2_9MAGN
MTAGTRKLPRGKVL